MTTETAIKSEHLAALARAAAGADAGWTQAARRKAAEAFERQGIPTTRDEEFRYTDFAPLAGATFERPAAPGDGDLGAFRELIERHTLKPADCAATLVFVDGWFVPSLSSGVADGERIRVANLATAIADDRERVEACLGSLMKEPDHGLTALNAALYTDGAWIEAGREVICEKPIQLLYINRGGDPGAIIVPRNVIVARTGSQSTVIETYVGAGDGAYFCNAATEILAEDNAHVDHYRVEFEGESGTHFGGVHIHQKRASHVSSKVVTMEGGLVRHDMNVTLAGEGGDCNLRGLYLADGDRHVDNHLQIDHAVPHCDSREFFKGILNGKAHGVFSGRILVREGAQKTDAKQTNQSLLLSESARVESKPQLEIFADDVKCTHGATIGQIDESALFYLMSRGLNEAAARTLLVFAFACEGVDEIKVPVLRERIRKALVSRMPHGELLQEAV